MNRRAEFAEIELISAHIGGQINLAGSKVGGKLALRVHQQVFADLNRVRFKSAKPYSWPEFRSGPLASGAT